MIEGLWGAEAAGAQYSRLWVICMTPEADVSQGYQSRYWLRPPHWPSCPHARPAEGSRKAVLFLLL